MARLALLLGLVALDAWAEDVLRGRPPLEPGFQAITDGQIASESSGWLSPEAVPLRPGVVVTWDLGEAVEVDQAAIQADNNDEYAISVSDDQKTWREVWRAPAVGGGGLVTRSSEVHARGRYFRLSGLNGDGRFSVSELELFRAGGGTRGSALLSWRWLPRHPLDLGWLRWVGWVALVLALTSARVRRIWVVLALVALGVALARLVPDTFRETLAAPRMNWLRAMVALAAALAVLRELLDLRRWPASRLMTQAVLAACAALAVLCFANLGHPQFFDSGRGAPTWLHHYDLRTYYPIAKYFRQLRFDGVYAASVAAVADDRPGGLDALGDTGMRDLRTHEVTDARRQRDLIQAVRARFSDEEWAAFRRDALYFRRGMGDGNFLGSMGDHGGNATPVWFLLAKAVFGSAPASDAVMWRAVVADVLLLVLAFAAIWVAFGRRTFLVALVVFGAQDFYQFGTNWFDAPLRHDWMALWGLGLAALRLKRFRLAGGLLAWAAGIRAFPALTFVVLLAPAAWALLRGRLDRGRWGVREWARGQRPTGQVLLGAAVATVVLVAASCVVFGPAAWLDWLHKVGMLDRDAHINNIAIRTWVSGVKWVWMPIALVSLAAVMFSVRKAPLETAAAMGVMLVPVFFNSANYYLHCVCLLPVLAEELKGSVSRIGAAIWLVLLLMCVASWPTSLTNEITVHFGADTAVLLVSLGVVLALQLARSLQRPPPAAPAAAAPSPPQLQPAPMP